MSETRRHLQKDPDTQGMWLRNPNTVERFPSFAGSLPSVLGSLSEEDDVTEPTYRTERPHRPLVSPPLSNREGATGKPAPRRTPVRRPRPSPLFGEGEIHVHQYTLRETVYMEDRPNTLWETELTDPGTAPSEQMWSPPPAEDSITLEVDPSWHRTIQAIDQAVQQGLDPIDIPFLAPPGTDRSLAARAPAPLPPRLAPLVEETPTQRVTAWVRLTHAAQALAWFLAGATIFGGTGAAFSLLVVAIAFTG